MDSIRFEPMPFIQIVILVFVLIAMFYIWYLEPRLSRKKVINKNEHGSSKFADKKEIESIFVKEKVVGSESVGFPVWYEKSNGKFEHVYLDNKSPHYLLIGSTGSGKSVTVVLNECLMFATAKDKHSVVVTDPKGEIFRATSKVFKDNGYNVITIDFRNPNKSNKINLMQPIIDEWKEHCTYNKAMLFLFAYFIKRNRIKLQESYNEDYLKKIQNKYGLEDYLMDIMVNNQTELINIINNRKMYDDNIIKNLLENTTDNLKLYLDSKNNNEIIYMIREYQNITSKHQAEANRLVISLADLIFVDKDTNDKFWINSAKQLFIGIVGIFLEDYQAGLISEEKINIASVKKFQNSSLIKENQNYLQVNVNFRKYGSLSKDYLTSILSASENTYKSITAVFGEKMAIFDDLNVENVTSISEFQFNELGKKPTVLYIIVPDEDRAYFQLVTIIIGMLTKDLTKFANLPENKGVLPTKVEWILDEFANCPPLNSIETLVSVARSRGMRFQFFIQSFAQLEQVYGKEIANIIIDNSALCYLKTNSVECAERIMKKLGKETIETNSINKSTDPLKIGANQTTSLMGRDLLNVTEIIGLKYKTIIFPTVSNPIFRDTYLYSDVYPQFKNLDAIERETKVLKRNTNIYYTVEELRKCYMSTNESYLKKVTQKVQKTIQKDKRNNVANNRINKSVGVDIIAELNNQFFSNLKTNVKLIGENTYEIIIDSLLSKNIINNIESYDKGNYSISLSKNLQKEITKLTIWDNTKEKKVIGGENVRATNI